MNTIGICRKVALILLFLLPAPFIYAIMKENQEAPTRKSWAVTVPQLLILDAGHGGADGGAVSAEGLKESEINLDIVLSMSELCRLFAVPVLLTRSSEDLAYPAEATSISEMKRWDTLGRTEIVNAQSHAFLLSIHQNFYPHPSPQGPQAFYSNGENAPKIADIIQNNMTINLLPENRRVAAPIPESVYLFSHVSCPAVLCECGFLSNPEEAEKLGREQYRRKIAVIVLGSYIQATERLT